MVGALALLHLLHHSRIEHVHPNGGAGIRDCAGIGTLAQDDGLVGDNGCVWMLGHLGEKGGATGRVWRPAVGVVAWDAAEREIEG